MRPIGDIVVTQGTDTNGHLSCHFSRREGIQLRIVVSFSINQGLSERILAYGPVQLFQTDVEQFLVLQEVSADGGGLSVGKMDGGIAVENVEPHGETFHVVLFVQLYSSFNLFRVQFLGIGRGKQMEGVEVGGILIFLCMVNTAWNHTVGMGILHHSFQILSI